MTDPIKSVSEPRCPACAAAVRLAEVIGARTRFIGCEPGVALAEQIAAIAEYAQVRTQHVGCAEVTNG